MKRGHRKFPLSWDFLLFGLPLAAFASNVLAFSNTIWRTQNLEDASDHINIGTGVLFATLSIPMLITGYSFLRSVRGDNKLRALLNLILAYPTLIVCFASLYYLIAWEADLTDAEKQNEYYVNLHDNESKWKQIAPTVPRTISYRAFKGFEYKLWTGIEELSRPAGYPADAPVPVDLILKNVAWVRGLPSFARTFNGPRAWGEVHLDCLHYSLVTMSTVGYGDISPQSRLAKVATGVQILCSQTLFLFALGFVFSKPEQTPSKATSAFPPGLRSD